MVGVVDNVRYLGLDDAQAGAAVGTLYVPYSQWVPSLTNLYVRASGDPLAPLYTTPNVSQKSIQDIAERTDGRIRLSPSTLYAVIKRLLESELIEELSERPDPAHDDERRRYYRLTPLGRRVAESEAARLTRLLADARASGLVPRRR